jgi:hypothetical protein
MANKKSVLNKQVRKHPRKRFKSKSDALFEFVYLLGGEFLPPR